MQENRFRYKLKTAEGVNQTLYPIIDPIEGTYEQLLALKNANGLIPGQWYKMTNYSAIWVDPINGTKRQSEIIEKLFLFAIKNSEFNINVISETYPFDIIYYSIKNTSSPITCGFYHNDSRGFIFRRILLNNNDCPFDSRGIKPSGHHIDYNSYPIFDNELKNKGEIVKYNNELYIAKKNIIAGEFNNNLNENWKRIHVNGVSNIGDPNSVFIMRFNNNNIKYSFLSNILNSIDTTRVNNLKIEPYIEKDDGGNHVLKLNNIIFNYTNSSSTIPASNIYIGYNCRNLAFNNEFRNIYIGNNCYNNIFRLKFINNKIGNNCNNNNFENCENNIIGDNFQYNTVGRMIGNQIGNDFQENLISDDFNYNTVGHKFQKKTIKNGFQYKKIDSNLTEEKDLDSHEKLFDDTLLVNLSKGINPLIPETKYMIRFFDAKALADVVNVLE